MRRQIDISSANVESYNDRVTRRKLPQGAVVGTGELITVGIGEAGGVLTEV